ncbi:MULTISPECIES: glycosyltransferase family 2 protein [Sphingobacterium]|uniref:glycosyltransferase family 2 protein n=1 Tax=Sphingobacterium TaxID=28453 RepID=UPI0013DAFEA5|nr:MULTISPECIES: glycosyltransferase family 2 protein [unclassified Sphingobacterium]
MSTKKISIIIANYNNGHFFNDCFRSLVNQTSQDWEAIVIDDKSTDDSSAIINELIKEDPRFRFYQNSENLGYQKTLIKGIELSKSPLFARLDPDDALETHAIAKSIETHELFPQAGLVYSNFTYCDHSLNRLNISHAKQVDDLNEDYLNFNAEISHFASFKKEIYEQTTGIDIFIKRAEDKDIYMKMCEVAPVKYIDDTLYLYRVHNQSISSHDNSNKALFWHWVALIKMAERTNTNIETLFVDNFISKNVLKEKLRRPLKSKWAKLGYKIGLFKAYEQLRNILK